MDPSVSSTPPIGYTEAEMAALAAGVTPEQLANRRFVDDKQRIAREAHANDTFWTPINPKGIVTIPRSLPLGVRQLASLLLLLCYPFWFAFCITWFLTAAIFVAILWVLLAPMRLSQKRKDPIAYAAAKNARWPYDILWTRLPSQKTAPGLEP